MRQLAGEIRTAENPEKSLEGGRIRTPLSCSGLGVEQSFSRSHTPYDNSVAEAFFKSLKTEELYRGTYRSEAELKACVTKYIDFFNNERPHKYLNYLTPAKKEELFHAQTRAR